MGKRSVDLARKRHDRSFFTAYAGTIHRGAAVRPLPDPPTTVDDRNGQVVGALDLFEFDPLNGRAGIGLLIYPADARGKGYAKDAVSTVCRYGREVLRLHQLWCNVGATNKASLALFRDAGFIEIGVKRDWLWTPDGYTDEMLFQKILEGS